MSYGASCGVSIVDRVTKRLLMLTPTLLMSCCGSGVQDGPFLTRSNTIMAELVKPSTPYVASDVSTQTHHMPFFEDSYGVRALCEAYRASRNPSYLAAVQAWTNRILADQARMIPHGAYYMNYSEFRQPGETQGDWYVADSSSVAQAVLCTAQLSNNLDGTRYRASAQQFFSLVEDAYTNPDGGTSNGIWGSYQASWWASTAIFGAFAFEMYKETGAPVYRERGLKSFDWLSTTGTINFVRPSFAQAAPGIILYTGEFYVQAWPYVQGTAREAIASKQLQFVFAWMAANQKSQNPNSPINYIAHGQTYMAGLPALSYSMQVGDADAELNYLRTIMANETDLANADVWALTTWLAWSESAQLRSISR
jgi:hypothetical protein